MRKNDYSEKEINGIVLKYEDLMEDGYVLETDDNVTFSEQYKQATRFVCEIVNQSTHEKDTYEKPCRQPCNEYQKHCNNVIAFMGNRGTGKTSTMLSFLCALKNYPENKSTQIFPCQSINFEPSEKYKIQHARFVALNCIDAGALSSCDDIIEIILARMLNVLRNSVSTPCYHSGIAPGQQEQLRELYQKFDSLFRNLRYLKSGKLNSIPEGESALRTLQNLSSSQSVIREFSCLVEKYLDFFDRTQSENQCNKMNMSFLVISLDDIDQCGGFDKDSSAGLDVYTLLEKIYDYLMIPRVVVLVTSTEQLLRHGCLTHLEIKYRLNEKNISCRTFATEKNEQLQQLTTQFIAKVLPTYHHINMPEFQNSLWSGTDGFNKIYMSITKNQAEELVGEGTTLNTKDFALKLIAKRTGVFYDAKGIKVHFFEQRNLRNVHDFLKVLESMDSETINADKVVSNRKALIEYISGTFYLDKLRNDWEVSFFERLLREPIDRRGQRILNEICQRKALQEKQIMDQESIVAETRYGYGELLYKLYQSTRQNIFSKELVHCILALYSVELSQLYSSCICGHKHDETRLYNIAHKELLRTIGTSVAGKWANKMLPVIYFQRIDAVSNQLGAVQTQGCWAKNLNDIRSTIFFDTQKPVDMMTLKQSIREIVPAIEMCWMFFSNKRQINALHPFYFFFEKAESPNRINIVALEKNADISCGMSACFNVLNFCVNSFDYEDFFNEIDGLILDAFSRYVEKNVIYKDSNQNLVGDYDLAKLIDEASLKDEYITWSEKYGPLAIPLHQFDMTYNIFKRLADATQNKMPYEADSKTMVEYCVKLYNNLYDKLREQSEYYKNIIAQMPDVIPFEKVFAACPFVKYIRMIDYNQNSKQGSNLGVQLQRFLEKVAMLSSSGRTNLQSG